MVLRQVYFGRLREVEMEGSLHWELRLLQIGTLVAHLTAWHLTLVPPPSLSNFTVRLSIKGLRNGTITR